MRLRKKIKLAPPGIRPWQLWIPAALALCLAPALPLAGLVNALSSAELPAVLLTFGLLDAAARR